MAIDPKSSPIVQLFAALQAEGIEFMVADMSAANLQGVLASTVDVDVWIGLSSEKSAFHPCPSVAKLTA